MRLLAGRPLVWYTIQAAKQSKLLEECYLSTDDPQIALFARANDVNVISRPAHLAQGESGSMVRTVMHAIANKALLEYDCMLLLQPTTPLRTSEEIDESIRLLEEDPDADSVVSFVPVEGNHPARMRVPDGEGYMRPLHGWSEDPAQSRQTLGAVFIRAGCIYLTRMPQVMLHQFEGTKCIPLFIDPRFHANIDTEADFGRAEYLIKERDKTHLKGESMCGSRFTQKVALHESSF
jgi:CMP-N-acetylneuraminic acid synthetase